MKRKIAGWLAAGILLLSQPLHSQETRPVLLTIDGKGYSLDEFERMYRKNNPGAPDDRKSMEEFLDLFVTFRLKVHEAMAQGLDTMPSFRRELNGYRNQLARPYLSDTEFNRNLVKEAYGRMQYDVRASHLLVGLDQWAAPEDTLTAWQRAIILRKRILEGESFESVARGSSDDPSVRNNGGDLGYFTALTMVYPFETAAYNTPPGELSMPVRTRFGYHLIMVTDKRPAVGTIQVAHIMVAVPRGSSPEAQEQAMARIDTVLMLLEQGRPFEELAKEYSDDRGSAARGGVLPWFGVGRMVDVFENAAFSLKRNGEISAPVRTDYGWHIIRRLEHRPVESFENKKEELEEKINSGDRSQVSREVFIDRLKEEYGYNEYPGNLEPFYQSVDSGFFTGNRDIRIPSEPEAPLIRFADREYTRADFADYLKKLAFGMEPIPAEALVSKAFKQFSEECIIRYEDGRLEEKYPDFRNLMQEYHDGILLFELTNREVWSKAERDSAGLAAFHQQHRKDYLWEERIDASIYRTDKTVNREKLNKLLSGKSRKEIGLDFLNKKLNLNPADSLLRLEHLVTSPGEVPWEDPVPVRPGLYNTLIDGSPVVVRINRIVPREPKKLEDARGIIMADYQVYLEEEWMEKLKEKYRVEINRELFESRYK